MLNIKVYGVGCSNERNLIQFIKGISLNQHIPLNIDVEHSVTVMVDENIRKTPCMRIKDRLYYDLSQENIKKLILNNVS